MDGSARSLVGRYKKSEHLSAYSVLIVGPSKDGEHVQRFKIQANVNLHFPHST